MHKLHTRAPVANRSQWKQLKVYPNWYTVVPTFTKEKSPKKAVLHGAYIYLFHQRNQDTRYNYENSYIYYQEITVLFGIRNPDWLSWRVRQAGDWNHPGVNAKCITCRLFKNLTSRIIRNFGRKAAWLWRCGWTLSANRIQWSQHANEYITQTIWNYGPCGS